MENNLNNTTETRNEDSFLNLLKAQQDEPAGIKVPANYFEKLNTEISNRIASKEKELTTKTLKTSVLRPLFLVPALSVVVLTVILTVFLSRNSPVSETALSETEEILLAYDVSYAEEVYVAELGTIDEQLDEPESSITKSGDFTVSDDLTAEEITEFLQDQDIDDELLNEN